MATAMTWLNSKRRDHLSDMVSYLKASTGTGGTLPATRAVTNYDIVDEGGAAVKAKSSDFIISVADLAAIGVTEPVVGDQIVTEDGSVYEVLLLAGANHYRAHDGFGNAFRIHTKLVGPC